MASDSHVLITSIGSDRPGIVEDLAGWILEQGGNIEDSRMSLLGGEFATLVLVSGDSGLPDKLESSRESFQSKARLTVITKAVSGSPPAPEISHLRYNLRATALDHPGIVHQVAQLLRKQSVNIVSAATQTVPAPFTGAPVFQFQMVVDVPGNVTIHSLRKDLNDLGDTQNIDFVLSAAGENPAG